MGSWDRVKHKLPREGIDHAYPPAGEAYTVYGDYRYSYDYPFSRSEYGEEIDEGNFVIVRLFSVLVIGLL
jgi:hypothetical protein